tara:strand:- start:4911 stop:5117 length:207 start_codon:yes stop_codon:yes gene_type:complete
MNNILPQHRLFEQHGTSDGSPEPRKAEKDLKGFELCPFCNADIKSWEEMLHEQHRHFDNNGKIIYPIA